uniref:Uncharacterized protein n=1 Tax=Bacillus thuringiensis serovar chinensis CT-43 TaxID=541229 RepID=E7CGS1_BACTU|nr:hypothetical protein pBMB0558_00740 [Bacillus thuringiensis serovar chinensis CT-43]
MGEMLEQSEFTNVPTSLIIFYFFTLEILNNVGRIKVKVEKQESLDIA